MTLRTLAINSKFKSAAAAVAMPVLLMLLAVTSIAQAQVTRPDELKFAPLPAFKVPKPTRFVLDNGMVVMVMEDHELPLVNVTARIRAGALLDPAEKVGLGSIAADMLRAGGTTTMKPDALDEYLEGHAASIDTGLSGDYGSGSMSALKADAQEVMRVFGEVLRHPAFDPDRLKISINEAMTAISRKNDEPASIQSRMFAQVIYGKDSPFAREETYATIGAITRDDLIAWHAKYLHPNRIILGIVGDITVPEAKALVTKVFGEWQKGPAATEKMPAPRTDPNPGVFEADKEDSTQSFVAVGHQGSLLRTNPDYYPVEVLNEVLSGGFTSRLFASVRTAKGLAYSVGGSLGSHWTRVAPFKMSSSTKVETTAATIEALITEVKDLEGSRPPTDEEVQLAKSGILNSFVFRSDTPAEVLGQQITFEYYGQPVDWLDRYRTAIEKVTTAEVAAVAKKYFHPDAFSIVVVGPEKGRDKPLSTFGKVTKLDISIPEPTSAGESTAAPAPEKPGSGKKAGAASAGAAAAGGAAAGGAGAAAATPEAIEKGKSLVAKAVEAYGGAAKVDGLTSLEEKGVAVVKTPQGDMEIKNTVTIALPDRIRQELTLPMGTIVMVHTPSGSFLQTPQGNQPLPESERANLRKELVRTPIFLLRNRAASDFKAAAVGAGKAGDTAVELVRVEYGGETVTLGIDPATGRVLSAAHRGAGPTGAPGEVVQTYSDFRPVDGLTMPFKAASTFNGEPAMSSTSESIMFNVPVDASLFKQPAAAARP
jgi:zinc protease